MGEMDFQTAQAQAQLTKSTEPLTWPIIINVLYIASYLFFFPGIIGVIMAHIKANQPDVDPISLSHYRYQMRTFWYPIIPSIIAAALIIVLIGWLLLIPIVIWTLVRDVKGLVYAIDRKPMPNPTTWLW